MLALRKQLLDDGMTMQSLLETFARAYLRGDRIARLLLNGHRDAHVSGPAPSDALLSQGDKDDIMKQLEREERKRS